MSKTIIFSINSEVYSESFINAQKKALPDALFMYGGMEPTHTESGFNIFTLSALNVLKYPYYRNKWGFNYYEFCLYEFLKHKKLKTAIIQYGVTAVKLVRVLQKLNITIIVHYHGFDASVKRINITAYNKVFTAASRLLVVSNEMEQDLLKLGAPQTKIKHVRYNPDARFFECKPKYDENYFVSAIRFAEKKNPHKLILGFYEFQKRNPDYKLYLCGDGGLLKPCKDLVEYLNIEDKIIFKGVLNRDQLKKLYAHAKGYVQISSTSSKNDKEGMPISILEAMAAGLPVISTRHAGIQEILEDNYNGIVIQPVVEEIKNGFCKLIDSDFKKLGVNARKYMQQFVEQNDYKESIKNLVNI